MKKNSISKLIQFNVKVTNLEQIENNKWKVHFIDKKIANYEEKNKRI